MSIQAMFNSIIPAIGSSVQSIMNKSDSAVKERQKILKEQQKRVESRKQAINKKAAQTREKNKKEKGIYLGGQLIAEYGTSKYRELIKRGEMKDGK